MTELRISPDLKLPIDVAGEAIGILATRGAGKSYTSAALVEELWKAKVQFAVLDPTGVYWGLRASADGKSDGLPIFVLGGAHGDVSLEPTAGALIADLLVDTGQSVILDLSDFGTKGEQTRFVTAFAERLYARKARARSTLHLVIDEANEFAPQKPMRDEARMLGALERLVGKGRSRGLGVTLITQRSAALNKNVLDLIETLVAMRVGSPRDRKAIEGWISAKDARDELGVMDSLPSLPTGTAWVWCPVRGILQKVGMRRIRTFDSYATPKPGEHRAEPTVLAPIDIGKLGKQIQATAERADANDPRKLQRQVAELRRQLAARPSDVGEPRVVEKVVELEVEVPVPLLTDEQRDAVGKLRQELERVGRLMETTEATLGAIWANYVDKTPSGPSTRRGQQAPGSRPGQSRDLAAGRSGTLQPGRSAPRRGGPTSRERGGSAGPEARRPRPAPAADDGEDPHLKAGARRILETFARHYPMRMTRSQLGTLARFKITGGTFQTYFSQLKRLGYLDSSGGDIGITQAGLDYIGHVPVEPLTTEEILEQWRTALKAGARKMLDVLVAEYPESISRQELADATEMTVTGGTFQTYLATLRRNGLIEVEGDQIRASDTLFIGAPA